MAVRTALVDDAPGMGRVHVAAWRAAYRGMMPDDYLDGLDPEQRATMWAEGLANPPRRGFARFVAVDDDGRVAGFAMFGPEGGDVDADVGELYAINIDPDTWGQGHGSALMDAGLGHLRDAGFTGAVLWVHPDNDRAAVFYRRHGWEAEDVTRREEVLGVEVPERRWRHTLDGTGGAA